MKRRNRIDMQESHRPLGRGVSRERRASTVSEVLSLVAAPGILSSAAAPGILSLTVVLLGIGFGSNAVRAADPLRSVAANGGCGFCIEVIPKDQVACAGAPFQVNFLVQNCGPGPALDFTFTGTFDGAVAAVSPLRGRASPSWTRCTSSCPPRCPRHVHQRVDRWRQSWP